MRAILGVLHTGAMTSRLFGLGLACQAKGLVVIPKSTLAIIFMEKNKTSKSAKYRLPLYSNSYGSKITDFYFSALSRLSVMLISPVSINVHKS